MRSGKMSHMPQVYLHSNDSHSNDDHSKYSHMPQAYQCMTTSERVHSVSSLCPGPTKRGREPTRVCKMACIAIVSNGKLEGPLGISNGKYDLLRSSRKYFRYDLVVSSTVGAAYPARGAV